MNKPAVLALNKMDIDGADEKLDEIMEQLNNLEGMFYINNNNIIIIIYMNVVCQRTEDQDVLFDGRSRILFDAHNVVCCCMLLYYGVTDSLKAPVTLC